jgi:hypothetical protein
MTDLPLNPAGDRIAAFRQALVPQSDDKAIVEQFLLHGQCFAIEETVEFQIKQRIAQEFDLNVLTDIFVVGSAKLGFSISPKKRWKHFGDQSDVDVAIVSHELYETVWHEVHDYATSNAYWPERGQFIKYLFQGWIRPDYLPSSASFTFSDRWWDFFRELKAQELAGPYKIAAGLYHDFHFLTKYHATAVATCRTTEEQNAD